MGEELKEACGLFGIYGDKNAALITCYGLRGLQHRGQESCGIVSSDGTEMHERIRMGLVTEDNFPEEIFPNGSVSDSNTKIEKLYGPIANGHVRYSTTGKSNIKNAQPLVLDIKYGKIAIGHNGNLTNALILREQLKQRHADFKSTTDTEVIGHLIAHSNSTNLEDAIVDALQRVEGAYSLLISSKDTVYAARDPYGFRPLYIGRLPGGAVVIASENYSFEKTGAIMEREVLEGELICVDKNSIETPQGYRSRQFVAPDLIKPAACIFEWVYFQRPDNKVKPKGIDDDKIKPWRSIASIRKAFGRQLWLEHPVDADVVAPVPDSGNYAASGYSDASGIPLELVFVRDHYSGRTFTLPRQKDRVDLVKEKLNVVKDFVKGKRVVITDDSIIRGTTSRNRIIQVRESGAKEVHLRISCPPTKHACYYGIDFPDPKDLIAANKSVEEICKEIGADTLGYLSLEGMLKAAGTEKVCTACWTNEYPTRLQDHDAGLITGKKC